MELPRYEYSRSTILDRITYLQSLESPFGLTVRYAVKANSFHEIIALMRDAGMHFDASSSYEAQSLLDQRVPGERISLSSQQTAHNLDDLLGAGVKYVATSMHQLELFARSAARPRSVAVRINPDIGSGHNKRTNTGGVSASFGIWYKYIPDIRLYAKSNNITIDRIHIHVGSGADPRVWGEVMDRSLEIVEEFPDAVILDIGGGYKVHRFADEVEADMHAIMSIFSEKLQAFAERTGRQLGLEIEPGTYLVAHAGTLVASIDDIVHTGENGYTFLKLNAGMNDFMRCALYGARHKIEVLSDTDETRDYIVVGHNCESGDIFTPAGGNPEEIEVRTLKKASIGDVVRLYDVGAYGASMSAKGYNAFPNTQEIMVD